MRSISKTAVFSFVLAVTACSGDDAGDDDASAGSANAGTSGSASGSSGASGASSGSSGTGGAAGSGTSGGRGGSASGAAGTSGASSGAGGNSGGGGSAGTSGGTAGSAGTSGGASAAGGNGGAGASGDGGSSGSSGSGGSAGSGSVMPAPGMNFFVTSRGSPNGGNLGSLEEADAFCKLLATEVSEGLGAKTWRAYLSTSSVDARDRIGTGPWRNQAGVVIADNVEDLHAQEPGEALDDTWPPADLGIALDENGEELANSVHDILTGSNADGTLLEDSTCNDWTSESEDDVAGVGHSNRDGGGRPPYFNATHTVGCAPFTMNYESGTVSSGGGRGSLYCFALEPSPEP